MANVVSTVVDVHLRSAFHGHVGLNLDGEHGFSIDLFAGRSALGGVSVGEGDGSTGGGVFSCYRHLWGGHGVGESLINGQSGGGKDCEGSKTLHNLI